MYDETKELTFRVHDECAHHYPPHVRSVNLLQVVAPTSLVRISARAN